MAGRLFLFTSLVSPQVREISLAFAQFSFPLFCQLPATVVQQRLAVLPNGNGASIMGRITASGMNIGADGCSLEAQNAHVKRYAV